VRIRKKGRKKVSVRKMTWISLPLSWRGKGKKASGPREKKGDKEEKRILEKRTRIF